VLIIVLKTTALFSTQLNAEPSKTSSLSKTSSDLEPAAADVKCRLNVLGENIASWPQDCLPSSFKFRQRCFKILKKLKPNMDDLGNLIILLKILVLKIYPKS
jgi:hypothetical protein